MLFRTSSEINVNIDMYNFQTSLTHTCICLLFCDDYRYKNNTHDT